MAEFYNPQFNFPSTDPLSGFLQGRAEQQQVQQGQMSLDQLKLALQIGRARLGMALNNAGMGDPNAPQSSGAPVNAPPGAVPSAAPGGGISPPNGAMVPSGAQAPAYDPNNPLAYFTDPGRIAMGVREAQFNADITGGDRNKPVADAQAIQASALESRIKAAQLQANMPDSPLSIVRSFALNPQGGDALLNNPTLIQHWQQIARANNRNPNDLSNENVRFTSGLETRRQEMALGLPLTPMPTIKVLKSGTQGQPEYFDYGGDGAPTLEAGAEAPKYESKEVWDPKTGTMVSKLVQTGGFGFRGASSGGESGGPSLGMKPPNSDEKKAANFANYMVPALGALQKIENTGYALPPSARSAIINAATSEDTGAIHSLLQQEQLKHQLGAQGQAYMAALMPVLQAAGHSMGGARLTAGQMRANFESLIPVDAKNTEAMSTIQQNRESYLRGLVGDSGSAVYLPEYSNTLGPLRQRYQSEANGAQKPSSNGVAAFNDPAKERRYQEWKAQHK